jgi:hypothetical protein
LYYLELIEWFDGGLIVIFGINRMFDGGLIVTFGNNTMV